ncbi:hypothetical protein ABENE_20995 [Asticcacaulis benevestitus DSM 16100 = ATCC BAA-896]|uniref:Uncharacterized protein n=1 Tax=Asticcacaulis benevestitus DSM 16100 = ATCC BAA-896 TaxID=1121022 RepID=V4PB47_9CAUL|nr:hypothetical protein ABENE_20995 [Asticcacaulis benevestitus DSM 16100 = ATCC BAA-896]
MASATALVVRKRIEDLVEKDMNMEASWEEGGTVIPANTVPLYALQVRSTL